MVTERGQGKTWRGGGFGPDCRCATGDGALCPVHTPQDTKGDTTVNPSWVLAAQAQSDISLRAATSLSRTMTRPTCLLTAAPCGDGEQSNAGENTRPPPADAGRKAMGGLGRKGRRLDSLHLPRRHCCFS